MKTHQLLLTLLSTLMILPVHARRVSTFPMCLWYGEPARAFEEALPIGNGKLGALIYGNADRDTVYLNDLSLWTGAPVDSAEGGDAYKWIPVIRKALFREDYKAADSLQLHVQGHNSTYYQPLGLLQIEDRDKSPLSGYKRTLSLDSAIATVRYTRQGIHYTREYFASHPDKTIAIRLTASKGGSINCNLSLTSLIPHNARASKKQITMTGHAIGDVSKSIHFCALLSVRNHGGTVTASDSTLRLQSVDTAEIYIVNETSYNGFDKDPVKEGAPYLETSEDEAWHLVNFTYQELRQRHLQDYMPLFRRVRFQLGKPEYDQTRSTRQQLMDYSDHQEQNPYLVSLYFQFGRYLLISSSRTPGLPPNLQGLWAPEKFSPWRGNYTININLEENYWPAEVTNLPELVMPLTGLLHAMSVTGRYTAKHYYGIHEGWCAGHNVDAWAMTNPVGEKRESPKWSNWNMGGAWLVETLWDHYDYTRDSNFLRHTAYPLMKGAAEFMHKWLIPNPKKPEELITAPSTSPEAEYITDKGYQGCTLYGGTTDMVIIRELFENTIRAARILHTDKTFAAELESDLKRLAPFKIGRRGNLQEWYEDWADQDWHHRHQSHLLSLYPFFQITLSKTPQLAAAAAKTLEIKGDQTTGWSAGWRISLWARLHRPDKAYLMLRKLLTYVPPSNYNDPKHRPAGGTYPNLFDAHPPFQIDGNFSGTTGICEMLMNCDGETMELLPALPETWTSGEISGLKARGNYTVDLKWNHHRLVKAAITANTPGTLTVRYGNKHQTLNFKAAQTINVK